ncbi:MAG: peptidoglycan DD-metalloendopeptidase family protein [bacterium]
MRKGLLILSVWGLMCWGTLPAYAAPLKDYKKDIKDKNAELTKVKERISLEKQVITKQKVLEKITYQNLQIIDKTIDISRKELMVFGNNIGVLDTSIGALERKIAAAEKQKKSKENIIRGIIRAQYKNGDIKFLQLLLKAENVSEFARRYKAAKIIGKKSVEEISAYRNLITTLETDENSLNSFYGELVNVKAQKETEQIKYINEKKEKRRILGIIQSDIKKRKETVKGLEASAINLMGLVSKIEKALISSEFENKTAGEAFSKRKYSFPWPLDRPGVVLSAFGKYRHPKFQTIVYNRGIEIKTVEGTPIYSIFKGEVKYADWFEGYGKMVIVHHGNGYFTIYAHLSDISVKEGDNVENRQEVGKAGDTESFFGESLYFEIRKKSEPVNPLLYLKKR